jgi:hypothetical protein
MIKSAPFSFIRFEHPTDNDYSLDQPYTLPAYGAHDVAFQFIVDDDRSTAAGIKLGTADAAGGSINPFASANATILSYRYRLAGYLSYTSFQLTNLNIGGTSKSYGGVTVTRSQFEQILFDDFGVEMIDDYFVRDLYISVIISATFTGSPVTFNGTTPPVWHQGFVSVSGEALPAGDSYTYALLNSDNSLLGYSNEFVIVDDPEYTSIVTYSCNEDGFGFVYGNSNKVRLPFYLLRPQHLKKRTVLRQSDGVSKVLSALLEKEYELTTEQMPEVFHECMAAMLSHDNISIECPNIRESPVKVIESDSYQAQWEDEADRILHAKAKGKLKVSTFGYSNSNCE